MIRFVVRRFLSTLPLLFIVVTSTFFILRFAPGGPFDEERALHPNIKKNLAIYYKLDRPMHEQYLGYMLGLAKGDLGPSFTDRTFSVTEKIGQALPYTMTLAGWALLLCVFFGILTGLLSALRQSSLLDHSLGAVVLIGVVVPSFLMAILLQELFGKDFDYLIGLFTGEKTDLLAVGGWGDGGFKNLALPVVALAMSEVAYISRLTRGSMIETMRLDFVRTARSKGIGEFATVLRHALRPSITPVISYLGPAVAFMLNGSLVVENIFGLPGMGKLFVTSALNRDYGMVQGTTVFFVFVIVIVNLIVDCAYALADPRVRYR